MKKWVKKSLAFLLSAVLAVCLVACGGGTDEAEAAVRGMFGAFQSLDFEEAEKYVNMETIADMESNEEGILQPRRMMEALFDRLSYNILSSEKKDADTVLVKTEVTAVNMTDLVSDWLPELYASMIAQLQQGQQPGEEQNQQLMETFLNLARQDGRTTLTTTVDIPVVRRDGSWRVEADEAFVDAVMGGLKDAANTIEEAFAL